MSGTLAPSKSTVYVSNLPFSLTNNDLHKIFEKYGKVVKVTVLSDKTTRKSKGVAFVLFLQRDSAHKAVHALNRTELFGRTIQCSIAKDNGRAPEFIRRREYKDKSRCYECGATDHLSYNCPKNVLGDREPPPKKEKKRKRDENAYEDPWEEEKSSESEAEGEDLAADSLAAAIKFQQEKEEEEDYRYRVATGNYASTSNSEPKRKKYKQDGYFSDEEELDT